MSATIQCPQCHRVYAMRQGLAGHKVRCKGCGRTFQVCQPLAATVPPPAAKSSTPAEPATGMDGLLDEAFGAPTAEGNLGQSADWTAGAAPATPRTRRCRMMDADRDFVKLGIPLALVGVILLMVFPLLGLTGLLGTVVATLPVLAGGGMIVYALRQNLPAALAAAAGALVLLVAVFLIRPDARTPEDISGDLFVQLDQMPELLESATDEAALEAVRSKVVRLYASMLKSRDRLSGSTDRESPGGRSLDEAIGEYDRRMRQIAAWLPAVPGGAELAHELAMLAKDKEAEVPVQWTPPQKDESELQACKQFVVALLEYEEKHREFPPDWDTLEAFLQNSPGKLAATRGLRDKKAVVQWGLKLDDVRNADVENYDVVLAYFPRQLEEGGWVVFMDGSIRYCGPADLREKLNTQAALVEAATDVAPPVLPPRQLKAESAAPDLRAWVPAGWTVPPPPESPDNRQRRLAWQKEKLKRPGIHDVVSVYVAGVPGESFHREIEEKLEKIDSDTSIVGVPSGNQGEWLYACRYVHDVRKFVFCIDVGPIVEFDEPKGEVRIRFDPVRFAEWEPADGGVCPPSFRSIAIPEPPEPPENRRLRQVWPKGLAAEHSDRVRVLVTGVPEEMITRQVAERLGNANREGRDGMSWHQSGPGRWLFLCPKVRDFRAFARAIDIGPIFEFDEPKGRILAQYDPARFGQGRPAKDERASPAPPPAKPIAKPTPQPTVQPTPGPIAKPQPEATGPPSRSVGIVPAPPEPPENVERRRMRSAGSMFFEPYDVYVRVEGASPGDRGKISRALAALYPEGKTSTRWTRRGDHPWGTVVGDVKDMRVFASRLDLGEITRYDEGEGLIEIKLDPAKLAAAPQATPSSVLDPSQGPFPRGPSFGPPVGPRFGPGTTPRPTGPRRTPPFGRSGQPPGPPSNRR